MLGILFSWGSPFRMIAIMIDTVAYSLIDNAYNLIVAFSSGELFAQNTIVAVMNNTYIVVGLIALFRFAILLVNSMISPDKLTEKGNGIGNILGNLVIMFILLIMTPLIFKEAINLQKTIVDGNYVQKIFLNVDSLKNTNPGKTMKSIAIGSLVTVNAEARAQYKDGSCSSNCKEAIDDYDRMKKNNNFSFATLSKNMGTTIKGKNADKTGEDNEGDTVYVYNYMFIVTFVCGVAITYVLLSFGIDIAVRMIELAVLEMLAPLFIATYIDPKSAKTGPFHKWLVTVGKTYASLFIKLAILSLMLLFVSLIGSYDVNSNLDFNGFEKLVLLLAILIFAKKAPKWIGGMVGVEGEGLGGIGIGKKIKDAVSPLNNKFTRGAAAITGAAVGNRIANARKNHRIKKDALDSNNKGDIKGMKGIKNGYNGQTGHAAVKQFRRDNGLTLADKARRNAMGLGNAIATGGKAGVEAKGLVGSLKAAVDTSKGFNDKYTHNEPGLIGKMGDRFDSKKQKFIQDAYGSAGDRLDEADVMTKQRNRKKWFTEEAYSKYGDNLTGGMGDFSKAITSENGIIAKDRDDAYAMITAKAKGFDCNYENGELKITNNGKPVVKSELVDDAKKMITETGVVHIDEMLNKKQSSTISEYRNNQEFINSSNQQHDLLENNLKQTLLTKNNISFDTVTGSCQIAGINGATIKIDPKNLKKSLVDALNESQGEFSKIALRDGENAESTRNAKQQLQNMTKAVEEIKEDKNVEQILSQLDQTNKNTANALNRQGQLQGMVDSVEGATLEQKNQNLALEADKITKKIKGLEPEQTDKK